MLTLIRDSSVVKLENMNGQNLIQKTAWKAYKKMLSNAFESQQAASEFSILGYKAFSNWLLQVCRGREIARYLKTQPSPSELFPTHEKPLRLVKFIMAWLTELLASSNRSPLSSDLDLLRSFPTPLRLHMLCLSLSLKVWQYTTDLLEKEAAHLAGQALIEPTFATFRSLNQCRQLVNTLILTDQQPERRRFSLEGLCWRRHGTVCDVNGGEPQHRGLSTTKDFDNEALVIRERLAALESRLKETFTLLVQAVTVVDSDANKKAASQATLLTLLAALYLPATLATGIFGMNIKLFTSDANAADWRPVIYTFLVVLAPSVAFIGYVFLPERKQRSVGW